MQECDKTRDHQHLSISRARLGLRQRFAHCVPPLLLRNHHRETLEVIELTALFDSCKLLRPR